jgi:putative hydrolase of the HAD superfamily
VCDTGVTPGPVVRRHLDALGLLAPLGVQIFSDEVGFPKPDPRAFRAALAPFGCAPGRAVHVGDLRRTDIAGARALGMRSVRIAAHHDDASNLPEADAVAASHAELRSLLLGVPS